MTDFITNKKTGKVHPIKATKKPKYKMSKPWHSLGKNKWQGPPGDERFTIEIDSRKMLYKTVWEVKMGGAKHKKLADFDTQKEAVAYAKDWMKWHPEV